MCRLKPGDFFPRVSEKSDERGSLIDKGGGRGHDATGHPHFPVCVDLELSSLTRENGRVLKNLLVPGLNDSSAVYCMTQGVFPSCAKI